MNKIILIMTIALCLSGCSNKSGTMKITEPKTLSQRRACNALENCKDSLDYVLSKEGYEGEMGEDASFHLLTDHEMKRAKAILAAYCLRGGGDTTIIETMDEQTKKTIWTRWKIERPLPLNHYYRQYVGYRSSGHVMVWINLAAHVNTEEGESAGDVLSRRFYWVHDGGKSFGNVKIDLTLGKVVDFSLNGEA